MAGLVLGASSLFAHDPGLSSANVSLSGNAANVVLVFNERDIAAVSGVSPENIRRGAAETNSRLSALARRCVSLDADNQHLAPDSVLVAPEGTNNVVFQLGYFIPFDAKQIAFESSLLKDLPFGHRQALAVRNREGNELVRLLLSAKEPRAVIDLGSAQSATRQNSFFSFVLLGIRHILTGYDHLLFLFGLLIVCRNLRSAALLISCFTLAHSVTLALSTFGLVNLPSRYVEPAIALSIIYVGYENLTRGMTGLRGRWIVTLAFGLIHGLGFASVLREMGVANSGLAAVVPLLGFNGGVEIGQLFVAAIVLPIIFNLRRRPDFIRVGVPACSAAVALAGAYWFLERTVFS